MKECPYCGSFNTHEEDDYFWMCNACGETWRDGDDDYIDADLDDWMFGLLDGTDDDTKPSHDDHN